MKLRLTLVAMLLFNTGMFADAQTLPKRPPKPPVVVDGPDAIPITVKSKKKPIRRNIPPPPKPPLKVKTPPPPPPPKPLGAVPVVPPVKIEKLLRTEKA